MAQGREPYGHRPNVSRLNGTGGFDTGSTDRTSVRSVQVKV